MNNKKTTLPSLRNIEWRTVKTETNRISQVLPYISTNNITVLNELIYAGANLVCEKIGISSKSTKKKSKQEWEIWLETQIKKIYDGIHGFWFKKFTPIHDRLALEMNRYLQREHVPELMTKGKTKLIQKDPSKGTGPNNYRPITCLPMTWKILTAQIREEIYYSLTSCRLFPKEQKGWRKGSRGTEELLYIDQHILNESKPRQKNLAMAWIEYKKAYDMSRKAG